MNFSKYVYSIILTLAIPDALNCTWWLWTIGLPYLLRPLCLKYEVEVPTSQQLIFILVIWLQKLASPPSREVVGEIGQWKNWVHLPLHCGVCNGRKSGGHQNSQVFRIPISFKKSYSSLNKVKNASVFSVTIISAVIATGTQCS